MFGTAVLAKELAAENYQVREPAFLGKERLVPAFVIFMRVLFDVERLAFAGEQFLILIDLLPFTFPDLQKRVCDGNIACAGYELIVQGTEKQACEADGFFLYQPTEEVESPLGKFFTCGYK